MADRKNPPKDSRDSMVAWKVTGPIPKRPSGDASWTTNSTRTRGSKASETRRVRWLSTSDGSERASPHAPPTEPEQFRLHREGRLHPLDRVDGLRRVIDRLGPRVGHGEDHPDGAVYDPVVMETSNSPHTPSYTAVVTRSRNVSCSVSWDRERPLCHDVDRGTLAHTDGDPLVRRKNARGPIRFAPTSRQPRRRSAGDGCPWG